VSSVRLLAVGGGGSGGGGLGGGGGAGEMVEFNSLSVTNNQYTINVGAGALPGTEWRNGLTGSNSRFGDIYAYGGGGGGTNEVYGPTLTGGKDGRYYGSSGGAGYNIAYFGGAGVVGIQGNELRGISPGNAYRHNGGFGSNSGGDEAAGGGGGGAGSWGSAGVAVSGSLKGIGGAGGAGRQSDITGQSLFYAGGGGGGNNGSAWSNCAAWSSGSPGAGGSGVGGAGGDKIPYCGVDDQSLRYGKAGAANTGSGGGGASNAAFGGAGGSGVVIVSYTIQRPALRTSPVVSGDFVQGETLTTSTGAWTFNPSSYTYQWFRVSRDRQITQTISGATSSTYVLTADDAGFAVYAEVIAVNPVGPSAAKGDENAYMTFIASEVTYSYEGADGGTRPDSQSFTPNSSSSSVTLPSPTKTGYTFQGWYTAATGGTKVGDAGATYSPANSVTLYAQWMLSSYTITFNKGTQGSGGDNSLTKTHDDALTLPNSTTANSWFTRTGYTVTGWSTVAGGTSSDFALGGSLNTNEADTLYPVWSANTYTVTYRYNDATGGDDNTSSNFTVDGTAITLPTPTRTGYAFDGWFESSTFSGSALGSTYSPTSSRTIYAKWTANTYTVTYDANGATGSASRTTDSFTADTTSALTLPTVGTLSKSGYTFDGWALTETGAKLSGTYTPTQNTRLYARWIAVDYSVTYSSQGSTIGSAPTNASNFNIGDTVTLASNGSLVKTGYEFSGWTINSNVTVTVYAPGGT
jgi:uncharacterized repeat protein (TIGR02543 family)